MAFHDNPEVDENSQRSEESINMIKLLINRKSNFLCREEIPDYGVDLDIELINQEGSVSANKFAVQVKSTKAIKVVRQRAIEYISLNFKTSRLGYLCRRSPGYGIIIIYNEADKKIYYEYVEEICGRLNEVKSEETWKSQISVNIHIPLRNELNKLSVKDIYEKMSQRFINHMLLLDSYGHDFNIPFSKHGESIKIIAKELEKDAPLLINNHDFHYLYFALESLDKAEINYSNKLCLYAAITYCEIGNVIEAKNYITRCNRFISEFEDSDIELLKLFSPRIDFVLGNLSLSEFVLKLKAVKSQITSELNLINIDLNLLHLKISNALSKNNYSELLETEILLYDKKIKDLNVNQTTIHLLQLVHADSILLYSNAFLTKSILRQMIKDQLGEKENAEAKKKIMLRFFKLTSVAQFNLNQIAKKSKKENNKLLYSEVSLRHAKSFLHTQTSLLICNLIPNYSEELQSDYLAQINELNGAYNIFINESRFFEAHFCLNYIQEIAKLYEGYYKRKLIVNEEFLSEVSDNISKIERSTGIRKYEPLVEEQLEKIKIRSKSFSPKESYLSLKDHEVKGLARTMLEISDLPLERLSNIVADVENYRKFYRNCKNPNLELLQDLRHLKSKESKYKTVPNYIIVNTKTGLETLPSNNIEELLEMVKYINNDD